MAGATLGGMSHAHRADHRPLILAAAAIAVLGAALAFQYIGGFPPCEMCHWQRWPWMAAIALAVLAALVRGGARRWLLTFGGGAVLASAAIGLFHAGVEYGWWEGVTACSRPLDTSLDMDALRAELLAMPVVRCDEAPFTIAGLSMAGMNAIAAAIVGAYTIVTARRA